jgi:transcriptional regulator with XRE-family HTH domain
MSTKKKSNAMKFLDQLRGGPLTFGGLIESLRTTDEISQVVLAKKLGISKAHLCDIEKGRRPVSAERAAKFAEVLGYPKDYFVSVAIQEQLDRAKLGLKITVEEAA